MIGIIKALIERDATYKHKPLNVIATTLLLIVLFFVVLFVLIV